MFVDFNKVFSKTPQTELRIPQELIDQLSSKLPDGLKYKYNEKNNNLFIFPESLKDSKVSIGGIMLEPNDEQKKILGDHFSFDDIIKLSYNTQQPVPVRFKNGKYVTINGKDIPIEHLHIILLSNMNLFLTRQESFRIHFRLLFQLKLVVKN